MNISLIQSAPAWEQATASIKRLDHILKDCYPSDLVILPEVFNTGFSMRLNQIAESIDGPTLTWMREKSRMLDATLIGSLFIEENGLYYNRFYAISPDGSERTYNKKHLYSPGGEAEHATSGDEHGGFQLGDFNILPRICYDLRFPVWNRSVDTDLMIFVASWPHMRIDAWTNLLKARAIENQCYVIGVNRVGYDGNGILHNGMSACIDPSGTYIIRPTDTYGELRCELSHQRIMRFRNKLPFYKDRDEFKLLS